MKTSSSLLKAGAVLVAALMVFPLAVDARGRAGGGGGFTRSSPASSGGFTGRPAATSSSASANQASSTVRVARGQPSAVAGQPRDAGSARGVGSAGGASSTMGAGQANGASPYAGVMSDPAAGARLSGGSVAAPVRDASPQDMAKYRQQFDRDNSVGAGDDERWDRPRPVDPDYSLPARTPVTAAIQPGTVAAGAVVGTAIARDNALNNSRDYVAGGVGSDYYTELPCSLQGNTEVGGSMYYKCREGWYKRVYRGDDVVYVQVDAPPGQ